MSITNRTKPVTRQTSTRTIGPQALFAGAVFAAFAVLAGAVAPSPNAYTLPAASSLLFVMATVAALIGWLSDSGRPEPARVTYRDVAGALTLVGIGAAALVEPTQLAAIFQAPHTQH